MGIGGAPQSLQQIPDVVALGSFTHTGVRQGDNLGRGLFRKTYDAGVAEWHEELDQHQWAQRLTCTFESDTFPAHAVPVATGGYADDLARTSIARSYKELDDINQLTTSSLATALGRRALQLHPKKGITLLWPQGEHSSRDLRAALLGELKAVERCVTATRYWGAQRTIEDTMTTERAGRCAAARAAFAQYAKY